MCVPRSISRHHSLLMEKSISNHGNNLSGRHAVSCRLAEQSGAWSIEAVGHSNLRIELFLTYNEDTWWLMSLKLNRRHISSASKDLGSLWKSDTDVEFPLVCCSWAYASISIPSVDVSFSQYFPPIHHCFLWFWRVLSLLPMDYNLLIPLKFPLNEAAWLLVTTYKVTTPNYKYEWSQLLQLLANRIAYNLIKGIF